MSSSRALKRLAVLGAVSSLWYAGLHIYWSVFANHLAPFATESGSERLVEAATLAAFYLPKVGVIVGAFAVFLGRDWALRIFGISWAIAAVHTALWYFSGYLSVSSDTEIARVVVHHVVPHIYFAVMVLILIQQGRTAMRPHAGTQ